MADLLPPILKRLQADFGYVPVTAAEIEFYLHGSDSCDMEAFWQEIRDRCAKTNIGIFRIEKERGREQHEISLKPTNPIKTARDTTTLKKIIEQTASAMQLRTDFSAKPLAGEPGSGLHIHVHLEDAQGKNIFYKDDFGMSASLSFSIGGLLAWMPACMPVFAPQAESYARFAPGGNAPTTISWGANNRTTAIRLPDAPHDKKRIEHRVAGSDADCEKVIAVILAAMHAGLSEKITPPPQIYGDASLILYDLPKLPANLQEAGEAMIGSLDIGKYFSVADLRPAP